MPTSHRGLAEIIAMRVGVKCHYCGCDTSRKVQPSNPTRRTIDHIKPQCEGGRTNIGNCVIACFRCNGKRGNNDYRYFMANRLWER